MAYQRGSRVAELLAHLLAPGESWGERWGYKSGVKGRVWVGVGVRLDPMRLTSPRRSAPARRSSPRCAGRTWMATGRWNRQLGRRLARAPEAVAGRSVGRPLPGSAELPRAAGSGPRRRRSRAGALPRREHFDHAPVLARGLRLLHALDNVEWVADEPGERSSGGAHRCDHRKRQAIVLRRQHLAQIAGTLGAGRHASL